MRLADHFATADAVLAYFAARWLLTDCTASGFVFAGVCYHHEVLSDCYPPPVGDVRWFVLRQSDVE